MPTDLNIEDYARVKEIFLSSLDLSPAEREAHIVQNCRNTNEYREIDSLLRARELAGNFLEGDSAASVLASTFENEKFSERMIDKYRIVREIGRGGMGVVFLAERQDFRQQVALKLIKRGMDSDAILERFRIERDILASIDHPFIAKLLDGGTTEEGTPYLVMEYVDGVTIDKFCDFTNRSEKEILEMFRKVCSAISYAHQKLVIHRDLKPTNILVSCDGTPKLLDFGIAKMLNSTDSESTQADLRILTPAYASPEQISGEIVGTASDVYSLGKILAELLGYPNLCGGNVSGCTKELGTTKSSSRKLNSDLKNVLVMALRDEAEQRYGSVESFSDDIRRYLQGLPVSARKQSLPYRANKFVRRNRLAVFGSILLVLAIVGGIGTTLEQAREAQREREIADKRFENLRKLSDSFISEINGAIQNLPGSLPARQLLLKRATEQLDALNQESAGNPALRDELAQAYYNLASLPDMPLAKKESTLKKEAAIYDDLLAAEPNNIQYRERLALCDIELADTAKVTGSAKNAVELTTTAVSALEQVAADEPANPEHTKNLITAYSMLASLYMLTGETAKGLDLSRTVLAKSSELEQMDEGSNEIDQLINGAHLQIGVELTSLGEYPSAIFELEQTLNGYRSAQTENPNDTSVKFYLWATMRRLAIASELKGDKSSALEYARQSLKIIEGLLAGSSRDMGYHRNSAISNILVGGMLVEQHRVNDSLPYLRRALELSKQVLANDPAYFESKIDLANAQGNLGHAMTLIGHTNEGLRHLRRAVEIYQEIGGRDTANVLIRRQSAETYDWIGTVLALTNRSDAREYYLRSLASWNSLRNDGKLAASDAAQPEIVSAQLAKLKK